MKCPRCWAEKAYMRKVAGFQGFLLGCALLVPMKCHHCYHKFAVPWFVTIGREMKPPQPRISPIGGAIRSAHAKKHGRHTHADRKRRRHGRADAA